MIPVSLLWGAKLREACTIFQSMGDNAAGE